MTRVTCANYGRVIYRALYLFARKTFDDNYFLAFVPWFFCTHGDDRETDQTFVARRATNLVFFS